MILGKANLEQNECSIYIDAFDYKELEENPFYSEMGYKNFLGIFFMLNEDNDYECNPPYLDGYWGECIVSLYKVFGYDGYCASKWHKLNDLIMGRLLVDLLGRIHLDVAPLNSYLYSNSYLGEKVYESDLWSQGYPF